jgi:hypothetical protein
LIHPHFDGDANEVGKLIFHELRCVGDRLAGDFEGIAAGQNQVSAPKCSRRHNFRLDVPKGNKSSGNDRVMSASLPSALIE